MKIELFDRKPFDLPVISATTSTKRKSAGPRCEAPRRWAINSGQCRPRAGFAGSLAASIAVQIIIGKYQSIGIGSLHPLSAFWEITRSRHA